MNIKVVSCIFCVLIATFFDVSGLSLFPDSGGTTISFISFGLGRVFIDFKRNSKAAGKTCNVSNSIVLFDSR